VAGTVQQLIATAKVYLPPGSSRTVQFTVHAALTCYTWAGWPRIPGSFDPERSERGSAVEHGQSRPRSDTTLTGQRREVGFGRALHPDIKLLPAD